MSRRLDVLAEAVLALTQAAERLSSTHNGVASLFPLTPRGFEGLPESERERLDAYAIRYARCQDLLAPTMRALGRAQPKRQLELNNGRFPIAAVRAAIEIAKVPAAQTPPKANRMPRCDHPRRHPLSRSAHRNGGMA